MSTQNVWFISPAEAVGGAEIYLAEMAKYARKTFSSVKILTGTKVKAALKVQSPTLDIIANEDLTWNWNDEEIDNINKQFSAIYDIFADTNLSETIVFVNLNWLTVATGILKAFLKLGKRTIVHVHLCPYNMRVSNLQRSIMCQTAQYHIWSSVSQDNSLFIRRSLAEVDMKIKVIYNGPINVRPQQQLSKNVLKRQVIKTDDFDVDLPWIITVGRHDPQKGFLDALDVIETLLELGHRLYYVWVGGGKYLDAHRAIVRTKNLEGFIFLVGESRDAADWIAAADISYIPSKYEGFSLSALEAAAAALPIVSGDHSSLPELYDETVSEWLIRGSQSWHHVFALEKMITMSFEERAAVGQRFHLIAGQFSAEKMLLSMVERMQESIQ